MEAPEGQPEGERPSAVVRCASQSSLDESSQVPCGEGAGGDAGGEGQGEGPGDDDGGEAEHALAVLGALRALRRDELLCDVRLTAGGVCGAGEEEHDTDTLQNPTVAAHRVVLAACSPYFRAMFSTFSERARPAVTIGGVQPAALAALVDYMYSPRSLQVDAARVQSLLAAASLLDVPGARALCCDFLRAQLAPDNALGIRAFAELHGCRDLAAAARAHAERHFEQVSRGEEFLQMDAAAARDLLDGDGLAAREELVLDAALRWGEGREPGELASVLEAVRLPLVPAAVLAARARLPPLLTAAPRVKDLLVEALAWHVSRPERECPRARPRRPPRAPRLLLVAGGQAPKAVREAELYCPESGRWSPSAPLPGRRCRAGLAALDGRVYAVGGFNGTLRVRSVDVYDVATDSWSAGPSMCARRSTLGVAVIGPHIYAVGGFDGVTGLSSAEVLDTRTGVWRELAAMSTRRSSVGVAALGGQLYAVGGYDGASRLCLASVERYDPAADSWQPAPSMAAARSGAGVCAAGGELFALGGHDGPAVRRSVEAWRPGEASWRAAAPMCAARRNAAVCALDGRLFVVGGDDGARNLSSAELYDPSTDCWSLLPAAMSLGRSYAGLAVVERPPEDGRPPRVARTS